MSDICVHHVLLVVYDTNKVLPYIWEHLISGFFHFSRHIFLVSTLYPEAPWGTEIICFSVAGFTGVMELQCAAAADGAIGSCHLWLCFSGGVVSVSDYIEFCFSGGGIIGVTEPRRVAAISMSKRVAEEMNLSSRYVFFLY